MAFETKVDAPGVTIYTCLSTDTKKTTVPYGSICYETDHTTPLKFEFRGSWVQIGTTDSTGAPAGNVVVKDAATIAVTHAFQVSAIGDITGEAIELDLTGLGVTRYRILPSVPMRVAEDAANVAQAESWLQAAGAWAALAVGARFCFSRTTSVWSEWRYFPEGSELTNLWFLRDSAGTATATAIVEYE